MLKDLPKFKSISYTFHFKSWNKLEITLLTSLSRRHILQAKQHREKSCWHREEMRADPGMTVAIPIQRALWSIQCWGIEDIPELQTRKSKGPRWRQKSIQCSEINSFEVLNPKVSVDLNFSVKNLSKNSQGQRKMKAMSQPEGLNQSVGFDTFRRVRLSNMNA